MSVILLLVRFVYLPSFCCSEACFIETRSWSFNTPNDTNYVGYLTVNSVVWPTIAATTSYTGRGFNTVELVLSTCSTKNFRHFDTYENTTYSDAFFTYLSGLPETTILVGATADEATISLTDAARNALLTIGVDVSQLEFRGKAAFIAQVGRPSATVMNIVGSHGNTLKLNAVVSGVYL
jgi:hypothetical protein